MKTGLVCLYVLSFHFYIYCPYHAMSMTSSPHLLLTLSSLQTWWRHQMETFSALMALCAGKSPVTGEFPAQRPVTRSFDVFFVCAWINAWVNNREAGDLRRHRAHYDVIVMKKNVRKNRQSTKNHGIGVFSDQLKSNRNLWKPNVRNTAGRGWEMSWFWKWIGRFGSAMISEIWCT